MNTDLETLLQPISSARPGGEDMMFSPEFDIMQEARRQDDATLEQGDWVVPLKEADWPAVVRLGVDLLSSRTKDIRLAAWVAEAWAKTRGFDGLHDGLLLVARLCDRYWDAVYPLAEEGDQQPRIGNLAWFVQRVGQLAREIPLSQAEEGGYAAADWESAALLAHAIKRTPDKAMELAQGKTTVDDLERARRATPETFYQALLTSAPACASALAELADVMSRRLGDEAPSVGVTRETLDNVISLVQRLAKEAGLLTPAPASQVPMAVKPGPERRMEPIVPPLTFVEASAAAPTSSRSVYSGAIHDRDQALALLRDVAAFFRRTEPHSPVAYLAEKAAGWGEMSLHLWLRTVMKDSDALARMEDLLGVAPPPER